MDLNTLYSQLVLRDLLGYIAPGAIVSAAIGVRISGGWGKFFSHIKALPIIVWIPLLAVIYLVGLAISGLVFEMPPLNRLFTYHNHPTYKEFLEQLANFRESLSPNTAVAWGQHHERYVDFKQGAANGAGALILSLLILVQWPATKPSFLDIVRYVGAVLLLVIAVYSLHRVHSESRDRQDLWEKTVISRAKHQSTERVSKIPARVQSKDGQHSTDSVNEIPPKVQPKDDQHQRR
jgi:hypothetical protein